MGNPSMRRFCCLLLVILLTSACSMPAVVMRVSDEEKHWLLSGKALLNTNGQELAPAKENVSYLTPEMRKFAEEAIAGDLGKDGLDALLQAMLLSSGMNLKYDETATFTAREAFEHGRANCLSFTHMFVAMARHVGFYVNFNEVDVPPIWGVRKTKTLVLNKHVNAIVTLQNGDRHVIDLNLEEARGNYERGFISDRLAHAQHYNNRAMELHAGGDHVDAFRYLITALRMEPSVSYFWSNLGSLYRRTGNTQAAEMAYRVALTENPGDLVAMSNASRLYAEIGNDELAGKYAKKVHYFRMRNPYYRYSLAMDAFMEMEYELAREHTEAAIKHYDDEHRFYFLLGAIYRMTGESELADVNFNKALELTNNDKQESRYRRKMDRMSSRNS